MRILSMTATFGKLEHSTLTLEPGLNIIDAPNEWGKSTWCAFLITMLYGLDTRERSTKTSLADKERYAPWSGSPMSGRIELEWQGRYITIERQSKGRSPMGVFRAYETETGLPVQELTATNCGQTLLGVERSVFSRAGFLRSADMPVGMNEELRRRLNALVTTGDDSAMADELGQKLRDLKNRCRYNRTGLIPQMESRRQELEKQLREHEALEGQIRNLEQTKAQLEQRESAFTGPDPQELEQALDREGQARRRYLELQQQCAGLPSREIAQNPPSPPKPKRTVHYLIAALCLMAGIGLMLLGGLAMAAGGIFLVGALVLVLLALKKKPEPTEDWQGILEAWQRLEDASRQYDAACQHLRFLQLQSKPDEALTEQIRQLHLRLGQYQGRMASIGDPTQIRRELTQIKEKLQKLELTEQALTLALQSLEEARQELQRRFAPGISKEAQRLFGRLTGGRYDRLTLGQDLAVLVGAGEEDTLRTPMWRSEGTVDQLYLALRLAVAQELTPTAPVILDDALIRFDDDRMATALEILRELSEQKQVIFFSCRRISG